LIFFRRNLFQNRSNEEKMLPLTSFWEHLVL